jgi:hypothetical protein
MPMPGMAPPMPPPPPPQESARQQARIQRLRPYTLPEPDYVMGDDGLPAVDDQGMPRIKRPRRPSKAYVTKQKEQRTSFWKGRNDEINADLALVLMEDANDTRQGGAGGDENLARPTGAAMVYRLANLTSRQDDSISVTPRADTTTYISAAQNCEDFLLDARREIDAKHAARGMQSYAFSEAWFGGACGWIISRNYLDPGKRFPICAELFDPRCCYPQFGDGEYGQLESMLYFEQTTRGSFLSANPTMRKRRSFNDDDDDDGADPDEAIEVIWYEDQHWSVLIVGDGEPEYLEHGYGFCPWLAVPVSGSPLMDARNRRHHGMGVIRPLRATLRYQDRLASQIATIVSRAANPAGIVTYDGSKGGVPRDVSMAPGARTPMDMSRGETWQPFQALERPDQVEYMQRITDEDVSNMGVPALLRGTEVVINSGFQFNAMRQNAEDVLQPLTRALITHRVWQHKLWLNLILVAERDGLLEPDLAVQPDMEPAAMGVPYRAPNRTPGAEAYGSQGSGYVYSVLTPEDIHLHGVENDVMLTNMTPQDYAQNGQVAGMLVEMGVIDPETASSLLLGIHNYPKMRDNIIYHQFMKLPQVVQDYLGPHILQVKDPSAYAFMLNMKAEQEQKEMMQTMMGAPPGPGGPGGPPGGPPGGAPPGTPPAPAPGLDSTALPPPMQAGTGQPGADGAGLQAFLAALPQQAPPV